MTQVPALNPTLTRLARPLALVGFEIGVNNWIYPFFSPPGVKDETSSATLVHDVIPGAWVGDSQRSCHGQDGFTDNTILLDLTPYTDPFYLTPYTLILISSVELELFPQLI